MKKFFALALVCTLVLALVPSLALAANVNSWADLKAKLEAGESVTLSGDIITSGTEFILTPSGSNVTLDLNGYSITATESASSNYGLIENRGTMTVKDSRGGGGIYLTATNNRGWGAYSAVLSNMWGSLTVENGVTIQHHGGTDMAYGIDNRTNTGSVNADVTVNGATIKSTYIAIRAFANSTSATASVTVTSGTIEGGKRAVWMQSSDSNENPAKLTISGGDFSGSQYAIYVYANGQTGGPMKTEITGGNFDSDGQAFRFTGTNDSNTEITGGSYSDDSAKDYVPADELIVDTNDGSDTPYVIGDDAEVALENAAPGSTVEILAAPANTTVTVPAGVTVVDNSGNVQVEFVTPAPVPAAPAEVPETGDHDLPILCAVLALLALVGMGLVKRVNDRI